ncbi:M48 family metalloprotease [Steroidobacter sp.]|uniref:M48 family metalloprotease n=1 Tax=Steroidobacter sp. TaxID=1978227 RepID=UPI001A42337A|nr:M48 family metalloprotease [Steroidobacter sp.]MBL8265855.1 M48 family metallopeptidase [Steroidobacter sp.]
MKIPSFPLFKALLSATLASLVLVGGVSHADPDDLPDIGSPAQAMLTLEDEYQIGRMIVRGLRDQDQILEDPEVTEYIRSLGYKLSSQAHDGTQRFNYFMVRDNSINAFALPGGFIGVNSGLLLKTRNESELAGVLAHEISHVTQRHIARSIAAQSRSSLVSTAAMLAAILVGAAAGGGDAAMAGVAAAQSLAIQQQISFTRSNEAEADRVGLGLLARSGFDPNGMPAFFETMSRLAGSSELNIPEMLRTHPVSGNRIAETKERAAQLDVKPEPQSASYAITRERLRVLSTPAGEDPRAYYAATINNEPDATSAQVYGKALALMMAGQPDKAVPIFERLQAADPTILQYHTALGQAQLQAGDGAASLQTLKHARELFPRNVAVTIRYAETLMQKGDSKQAHEILLDLFNTVPPTPEQAKLTAQAANAAGDVADSYYYMSEYHILSGDLLLAVSQLQLALAVPKISEVQRARFEARLDEIQQALPKRSARRTIEASNGDSRRRAN